MRKLNEECGVFGIYAEKVSDIADLAYYGLLALQHRGQESAGIVVNNDGVFTSYRDEGLVNEVFHGHSFSALGKGNMALGHVRYGTTGKGGRENAQPIVVQHMKGNMALCHNGNLTNSYELRESLESNGSIFHTTSDTEVISYIITRERLTSASIEQAVSRAMDVIEGAYSLIVMSPSKMIAARDPNGFHPLCYGRRGDGSYVIASETCALDAVGAVFERSVEPGEIVVFTEDGVISDKSHCGKVKPSFCIFEYIYFARPDSVLEGDSVHRARFKAGALLAEQYPVEADVVIGVPDSGLDAAVGYSKASGIPYEIGFIKNKYIGRTFIAPGQRQREDLVKIKLNAVSSTVSGKRVVLIDDSIVRGTTSARIVRLLRDAGAKEVHMRVTAPAFTNPCYYGTDIDSKEHLIACRHTHEEIEKIIGVDSLGYISVENLYKIVGRDNKGICTACFDGNYPTKVCAESRKLRFEQKIGKKGE